MARIAGHALEVTPEDLEWRDGVACVKGAPRRPMTVAEIAALASPTSAARGARGAWSPR